VAKKIVQTGQQSPSQGRGSKAKGKKRKLGANSVFINSNARPEPFNSIESAYLESTKSTTTTAIFVIHPMTCSREDRNNKRKGAKRAVRTAASAIATMAA